MPYNFYIQKNPKTHQFYLIDRKYVEWKPILINECNEIQTKDGIKTVQSSLGDDYIMI